ncbi:MAG: MFS transporter [Alphaproteobacteria bacterium]
MSDSSTTIQYNASIRSESAVGDTSSFRAWVIWFCVAGFYLYEMILRVSPGVMTDSLMRDFAISATAVGLLASCYHHTYTIIQIPCGIIVDRLGVRLVVTASAFLCAAGSLVFALSQTYSMAVVGQYLIGIGSACAFLSTLKVIADWFPAARFAMFSGLTNIMGTFGATFGGHPLAVLVNAYGWRQSLIMAGGVGLVVAVLSWLLIRDPSQAPKSKNASDTIPMLAGLKLLIRNPQVWMIGLLGGLTYVVVAVFASIWAVPFLMQTYGIDNTLAAIGSLMIFLGVAIGSPIIVLLSEFLHRRILTIGLTSFANGLVFLIIIFVPNITLNTMFGLLFVAGFLTGGQILCFACAKEITPHRISGTAMGFINALVMFSSSVLLQPVFGGLLDLAWDGQLRPDGLPLYGKQAFQIALSIMPICSLLSIVLLYFIKETYHKNIGEQ